MRSSIHCSAVANRSLAQRRASRAVPRTSETRSACRKKLRQLKTAFVVRKFEGYARALNSSSRLKPPAPDAADCMACTIDSEITMARVQDDIW